MPGAALLLHEDEIRSVEGTGGARDAVKEPHRGPRLTTGEKGTGSIVGIPRKLDVPRVGRRRHLPFDC